MAMQRHGITSTGAGRKHCVDTDCETRTLLAGE